MYIFTIDISEPENLFLFLLTRKKRAGIVLKQTGSLHRRGRRNLIHKVIWMGSFGIFFPSFSPLELLVGSLLPSRWSIKKSTRTRVWARLENVTAAACVVAQMPPPAIQDRWEFGDAHFCLYNRYCQGNWHCSCDKLTQNGFVVWPITALHILVLVTWSVAQTWQSQAWIQCVLIPLPASKMWETATFFNCSIIQTISQVPPSPKNWSLTALAAALLSSWRGHKSHFTSVNQRRMSKHRGCVATTTFAFQLNTTYCTLQDCAVHRTSVGTAITELRWMDMKSMNLWVYVW